MIPRLVINDAFGFWLGFTLLLMMGLALIIGNKKLTEHEIKQRPTRIGKYVFKVDPNHWIHAPILKIILGAIMLLMDLILLLIWIYRV